MKTRRKTKTSSYPQSSTQVAKDDKNALEKARSALKKTEGAHTPNSIKRKLMTKKGKK